MGQLAIALGVIVLLALLWRVMRPGRPLFPSLRAFLGQPSHHETVPIIFPQLNPNSTVILP